MSFLVLLKFVAAFTFVIGLMLLLQYALKRFGLATDIAPLGGRRRLKVVEHIPLDHRRRLALVRRDDVEHLIVLGPSGETVVETGIAPVEEKIVALKEAAHG